MTKTSFQLGKLCLQNVNSYTHVSTCKKYPEFFLPKNKNKIKEVYGSNRQTMPGASVRSETNRKHNSTAPSRQLLQDPSHEWPPHQPDCCFHSSGRQASSSWRAAFKEAQEVLDSKLPLDTTTKDEPHQNISN